MKNPFPFRNDTHPDLTHTIRTVVGESHTRAQLEKLSTTRLRELKKTYEARVLKGDKDAARELADIRGLLRSKGAGHALDEASACERAAAARLKAANAEDLKEKGGAAGAKAHKRLHKTIKSVVGEGQEYTEFLEGIIDTLCEELGLDSDALLEDVFDSPTSEAASRANVKRVKKALGASSPHTKAVTRLHGAMKKSRHYYGISDSERGRKLNADFARKNKIDVKPTKKPVLTPMKRKDYSGYDATFRGREKGVNLGVVKKASSAIKKTELARKKAKKPV